MKILVTGSVGFLGREAVKDLRHLGHFVYGVDRLPEPVDGASSSDTFFQLDLAKGNDWPGEKFDLCIHLASDVGGFLYNALTEDCIEREVAMVETVARWSATVGCKRIVYLSSINVFEGAAAYEHAPVQIQAQTTPYAKAKVRGESRVVELFEEFIIVRPTNIFGARQVRNHLRIGESHVIPDLLHKISLNSTQLEVFGTGEQIRNFIHVGDVSRFILRVIARPQKGWFNLRSDITLRIADLAEHLLRYKGTKRKLVFQPQFMGYEHVSFTNFDLTPVSRLGWAPLVSELSQGLVE